MMIEQKHRPKMQYKLDAVINQSKKELSEDETRVLARGFKFRPSLKELPIKDIVVGTEAYIKTAKVAQEIANHMRSRVAKEIDRMQAREKRRPTKQNMTTKEWVAVHKLKADTDRIIIPAYKGDKSIVMEYSLDKEEHNEEEDASAIMENESYLEKLGSRIEGHIKVDEDPAKKHEKLLNAALTKMWQVGRQNITTEIAEEGSQLLLRRDNLKQYMTEGAISPTLKGKLKEHKEEKPLRKILDATKAPGHKLGKVLNKLFDPYTRLTKTAINGGNQLIELIREGRFDGNFLASSDAVALYPSVLVEEGL